LTAPDRALVIVDRDGVVNEDSPDYIKSPEEWRPVPGAIAAIARLTAAGYDVVVVTNQSGIARGLFDRATLEAIHGKMRQAVCEAGGRIAAIYHCPHAPEDQCQCRKPQPGLLLEVARDFGVPLTGVPFIGDKRSDVEAAINAGAMPVLVGQQAAGTWASGIERYRDLAAAVDALLGHDEASR
jgi:D-glycero-D-manno-heptose 1,7-bisphosphate phosphatase